MSSGSRPAVADRPQTRDGGHRRGRLVGSGDAPLADARSGVTIHSSEVSTIRSRSALVRTWAGA